MKTDRKHAQKGNIIQQVIRILRTRGLRHKKYIRISGRKM